MQCMKCNKPIRFWHRKFKLFRHDYVGWHWGCYYPVENKTSFADNIIPTLLCLETDSYGNTISITEVPDSIQDKAE